MTNNLLQTKRFLPLLITQFLGALNDNLFKNALLTLVAIKMSAQSDILSNVIAGLFILPFFLFSAWAGEFADKYPRDKIARILKVIEIILMLGVAVAYYFNALALLILIMTLMGTQSAFFGPIKYALLPQHLKPEELITGNAYIEATTYGAILFGLILGTLLPIEACIVLLISLAIMGYIACYNIPQSPAPRPEMKINKNLFSATTANYRFLKKHRFIFQSILGASWFWMIGALVAVQIYPLCSKVLNTAEGTITFFLVLFSLGVAVGSYACNRILKGYINTIYVPLSAVGMALCLLTLWLLIKNYPTPEITLSYLEFLQAPRALSISLSLFSLAFFGGLYIIPLNAFMQSRAPKAYTASVIAGNNIFNALGMTAIAIFAIVLFKLGFDLAQLFLIMGIMSLVVATYICSLLPDALTRSLLQTLLKFMFRTKVSGLSHFKKAGKKVLIISNHTSLWDGVLLAAFMPERITFAINKEWTEKWFLPIIRVLVDFYPIDTANPLSIRALIEEIKKGRKVMMFPEGRISLTGKIMKVYDGAAMIAAKAGAKLLPVRINGAQYSKLSYVKDKFRTRLFPEITLHILEARKFEIPLTKNNRALTAHKLYELLSEMIYETSNRQEGLFQLLINSGKVFGKKHIIAQDIIGNQLSYKQLINKSASFGEYLRSTLANKDKIGVNLVAGIDFLIAFFALSYLGKTIVLLDPEKVAEQIKTSGVQAIISSSQVENISVKNVLFSEIKPKWKHVLKRKFPAKESAVIGFKNESLFLCSQKDLLTNFHQLDCVLPLNNRDIVLNCLPTYSPDALVLTTILPLLNGAKICYSDTIATKFIPHLCYDLAATILFGNATIFKQCLDEASAFDFFNVRMSFSLGKKVDDTILDLWLKNFGLRILENWTPTASALIYAINTPMYNRFGSLGCLLPKAKIIPQNYEGIKIDEDGFIWELSKINTHSN